MRMERDVLMIFIDVDHSEVHQRYVWTSRRRSRPHRHPRVSCERAAAKLTSSRELGGDEFVALMTVESDQTAELVCERIKRAWPRT